MYADLIEKWLPNGEGEELDIPLWKIAREIEYLANPICRGNLAAWYARGLETLLDWEGGMNWARSHFRSVEDFRAIVAADRAEMEATRKDDPEYRGWDPDEIQLIEAWLAQTPYEVYKLVREFKARMCDRVDDEIFDILNGDAPHEVRSAEDIWEGLIQDWKDVLAEDTYIPEQLVG